MVGTRLFGRHRPPSTLCAAYRYAAVRAVRPGWGPNAVGRACASGIFTRAAFTRDICRCLSPYVSVCVWLSECDPGTQARRGAPASTPEGSQCVPTLQGCRQGCL